MLIHWCMRLKDVMFEPVSEEIGSGRDAFGGICEDKAGGVGGEKRRENLKYVLDSESVGGIDRDNEGTFEFVACSTEGGECFGSRSGTEDIRDIDPVV